MAQGSLSSGTYVRPYISAHGAFRTLTIEQGSTVSTALFKIGDAIARGASTNAHRAVLLATGVTANLTTFLGFAAEEAFSSATVGVTKVTYWPADDETQFLGVAKGTLASTQLGQFYNLRRDSTLNIAYLDLTDKATGVMCVIDDFAEGSTIGDSNGFVVFRAGMVSRQVFNVSS